MEVESPHYTYEKMLYRELAIARNKHGVRSMIADRSEMRGFLDFAALRSE